MLKRCILPVAGVLTGLVNGLFGGGGGMVLLPLLSRFSGLSPRRLYATGIAIIFPLCLLSAAVYLLEGQVDPCSALPFLLGGALGGLLGGRLYRRVPTLWLRRLFALFLLYAAVRYLR